MGESSSREASNIGSRQPAPCPLCPWWLFSHHLSSPCCLTPSPTNTCLFTCPHLPLSSADPATEDTPELVLPHWRHCKKQQCKKPNSARDSGSSMGQEQLCSFTYGCHLRVEALELGAVGISCVGSCMQILPSLPSFLLAREIWGRGTQQWADAGKRNLQASNVPAPARLPAWLRRAIIITPRWSDLILDQKTRLCFPLKMKGKENFILEVSKSADKNVLL